MQYSPCPICNSDQQKLLFERLDHTHYVTNDRFRMVRCRSCSMVFVNPRPDPIEIKAFYTPDFYDVAISAEKLLEEKRATLQARAKMLSTLSPGRLLDIGCQKGEFLFSMKRLGWRYAIALSETPPNMFNMPNHLGRVETATFEAGSSDVVSCWPCLSMARPGTALRGSSSFLAPKGRAYVLVPNFVACQLAS